LILGFARTGNRISKSIRIDFGGSIIHPVISALLSLPVGGCGASGAMGPLFQRLAAWRGGTGGLFPSNPDRRQFRVVRPETQRPEINHLFGNPRRRARRWFSLIQTDEDIG
jgi:hypothetical protein